jgi:cytoskeleton protein RodZ
MTAIKKKRRQSQNKAQNTSATVPSPGKLLQKAREAMGMEVATVAEQLHLSRTMVQALEEENYEVLPARVFVRGYYRNFARLVGAPVDVVLREFGQRCPEGEDCSVPPAVAQGVRKEIRSNHGLVRLATWFIVIALISVFGLWLKKYLDQESKVDLIAREVTVDAIGKSADIPATMEVSTGVVQSPVAAEIKEDSNAGIEAPSSEGEDNVVAAAAVSSESVEDSSPVVAESPQIQLSFSGDCWVDVRDSTRTYKLVGRRKAGEKHELKGKPPYKMVLGNARNVSIQINGKVFDLAPYTKGNVAKLTFDPTKN